MILENQEIQLRPYILEMNNDILKAQYLNWVQDYENIEFINSISLLMNDDVDFIKNSFLRFASSNSQGFFIYHKESKRYLGTVKLDKIDFFRKSAEFGIMIGEKDFKGKKIGSYSMELVLKYAFEVLGLNRIWGGTDSNNLAMRNLFIRCGFIQEGELREHSYINGKYSNGMLYGLLKKEWKINE